MINLATSVEKELKLLSHEETLGDALKKLDLTSNHKTAYISDIVDWQRTGGETYCMFFTLNGKTAEDNKRLVLKACISSPLVGSDKVLSNWIERRTILQNHNISTPVLYAYGNGVILEEYIPFTIEQALSRNNDNRHVVFSHLKHAYDAIETAGFSPSALLHNFRSRGNDVVNVDFGNDLGSPSSSRESLLSLFKREIKTFRDKENNLRHESRNTPVDALYKAFQYSYD